MTVEVRCIGTGATGNSYMLLVDDTVKLLDCGVPYRKIRDAFFEEGMILHEEDDLVIYLTHSHPSSCEAVDDFLRLTICKFAGSDYTLDALGIPLARRIDDYDADTLKVTHDRRGTVAFDLDFDGHNVLYLTDAPKFPKIPSLTDEGSDWEPRTWVIEVNYDEATLREGVKEWRITAEQAKNIRGNHLSLEQVCRYLKKLDSGLHPQNIYVCNMSNSNCNAEKVRYKLAHATNARVTIY